MFRSITESYLRGAGAIVIVYDITNRESFTNALDFIAAAKRNNNSDSSKGIYLVGNK
jgi:GTPase SAR1 family protein